MARSNVVPKQTAPQLMQMRNLSAGNDVRAQSRRAVEQIAAMEQQRQILVSKGYVAAAGRTLQGMADVVAAAPTLEELQNAVKALMTDGSIISGRDYYSRIQAGLNPVWYQGGFTAPGNLEEYVIRRLRFDTYPNQLQPYVLPGVQAASYWYASVQSQRAGAALNGFGSSAPASVVDAARIQEQTRKRMTFLMGLAGGVGGLPEEVAKVNLLTDVHSGRIRTAPDTKFNDPNKVFGVDALVCQNKDNIDELKNCRKVKVAWVVDAFKRIHGREPNAAQIKFYASMRWGALDTIEAKIRQFGANVSGAPPDSELGVQGWLEKEVEEKQAEAVTAINDEINRRCGGDKVKCLTEAVRDNVGGGGGGAAGGACQQLANYPAGTQEHFKKFGAKLDNGCWYGWDGTKTVVWGSDPAVTYAGSGGDEDEGGLMDMLPKLALGGALLYGLWRYTRSNA